MSLRSLVGPQDDVVAPSHLVAGWEREASTVK